jgi:hypothetical protein
MIWGRKRAKGASKRLEKGTVKGGVVGEREKRTLKKKDGLEGGFFIAFNFE